ncbi:hypothetical protein O0L34_g13525 [Tuta absoluta]|nr:hypothetical protein O0L34_g13525 [Tuta absoluta]
MASKKHIFSSLERKVFLDILKVYSQIIENKNTDGATVREKKLAWENIASAYNSSPYVTAEASNKQLRRLWMNLKQRQREAITKERQHRMATGGGPSTNSAEVDPDISQIAPGLMVEIPGAIDLFTVDLPLYYIKDRNISL